MIVLFKKKDTGYEKHIFYDTSIYVCDGIDEKDNGFFKNRSVTIRIFDVGDTKIAPEDKVEFASGLTSPTKEAYTVMKVFDNKKGINPHVRIEVKW